MQKPVSEHTALDTVAIAHRLYLVLEHLGLAATVFCQQADIPYSTWRTYMSGKRAPSPEVLAAMAHVYRISATWVLTGIGAIQERSDPNEALALDRSVSAYAVAENPAPWRQAEGVNTYAQQTRGAPFAGTSKKPAWPAVMNENGMAAVRPLVLSVPLGSGGDTDTRIEYQVIPRRAKPAAAGNLDASAPEPSDAIDLAGDIALSYNWLRRNMGKTVGPLSLVDVDGTSMAPTLLDGETIMIDEGINTVSADDIYVLDIYGRRLVKRVQHLHDGSLVLISDNPAYRPESLPRDVARNVRVVGRMVWPRLR